MQQLPGKMPQPEPENRCPNCLYMKLEDILVQAKQKDLHLTIIFNEQWEPFLNGRIKFGLKGGELKLRLENGDIPEESRNLTGLLELSVESETGEIKNFPVPLCEITTNGSMTTPAWVFRLKNFAAVLKGSIESERLGTLNLVKQPCSVEATFEVLLRDVHLIDIEGLYAENIDSIDVNKQSITKRLIEQYLLKSKFQPYLSRMELQYG